MQPTARELELRRLARREGLKLVRCPSRIQAHHNYDTYMLVDRVTDVVVYGDELAGNGLDLNDVEQVLNE